MRRQGRWSGSRGGGGIGVGRGEEVVGKGLDHVAPAQVVAMEAARLGEAALEHVLERHRPLGALFGRWSVGWRSRMGAWPDVAFVQGAARSLLRWWGWIEPLRVATTEEALLIAVLMDADRVPAACRIWAGVAGRRLDELVPCGDAPSWTARTAGFKRLAGRSDALADPWRLFPAVYRSMAMVPPGEGTLKERQVEAISWLQKPAPVWVRVEHESGWERVRAEGWKPWIHRRLKRTGRIERGVPAEALGGLASEGVVEIQDLGSQLVGYVGQPQRGQRWWVPVAERGVEAIHLAALMEGKGVVVASAGSESGVRGLLRKARVSPHRNLTARVWDGRHVVGKAGRYDGVVVTPASTAIGAWRRMPEGRWLVPGDGGIGLAERQQAALRAAAAGVKPGGVLVYAVPTLTVAETRGVIQRFLEDHPEFTLEPFCEPLEGAETDGTWTLWPMAADSDGWFYARMRRAGG
ncbi:MAG: tRNA/rRNA cytosine-C5-methylase RsmB [Isosphaeraceae bacterium]|nr:MAG: tRNA/rRNA cytosine-C5-methylase RsmB [Isosphaeraceae bacterium]